MASSQQTETHTIELNKENSIKLMGEMVRMGQEVGHYALKDSFIIHEALRFLEYDEGKSNAYPKPDLTEKAALQILVNAIAMSQKMGHCFSFEVAANAYRVVTYVSENFLKPEESEEATEPVASTSARSETPKSRLPCKKKE